MTQIGIYLLESTAALGRSISKYNRKEFLYNMFKYCYIRVVRTSFLFPHVECITHIDRNIREIC